MLAQQADGIGPADHSVGSGHLERQASSLSPLQQMRTQERVFADPGLGRA